MGKDHITAQIEVYSRRPLQVDSHWARIFAKRRSILARCVTIQDRQSLLEIGCHGGEFLSHYANTDVRRVGIDICEELIQHARDTGIEAYCHDTSLGIPFGDETFDVVIMTELIEHIIDTDALLKEVRRVLKPNGHLYVSTPNICSLKNRLLLLAGRYPQGPEFRAGGAGHVRVYSVDVLASQLRDAGFRVLLRTGLNLLPDSVLQRWPVIERLDSRLAVLFPNLCSSCNLVAAKLL